MVRLLSKITCRSKMEKTGPIHHAQPENTPISNHTATVKAVIGSKCAA
jgi:hypothetical protein